MNEPTELVRLAKAGDAHAFALLYETVYQDLYRFAVCTLRSPQDAEDAVSEAVLDAFAQISTLREAAAFSFWIFRILTAKCRRKIRQYAELPSEIPEELSDHTTDLTEQIDVKRAFHALPDEDRIILALKLFAGYSSAEIGKLMSLNPATVRSRQSRALRRMETALKGYEA